MPVTLRSAYLTLRIAILIAALPCVAAKAQSHNFYFVGLGGISTLSADGRSILSPSMSQISLYKPENGPALNVAAGWDFSRYLSLQGNYIWNANDLTLVSTAFGAAGISQYQETRSSRESGAILDLLGYMRARGDRVRPYLSCGTGLEHFSSSLQTVELTSGSLPLPPPQFSANHIALRVAVGIDFRIARRWAFRYSFSDTITSNPISRQLDPPGQRGMEGFQNLFGLTWHF